MGRIVEIKDEIMNEGIHENSEKESATMSRENRIRYWRKGGGGTGNNLKHKLRAK